MESDSESDLIPFRRIEKERDELLCSITLFDHNICEPAEGLKKFLVPEQNLNVVQ